MLNKDELKNLIMTELKTITMKIPDFDGNQNIIEEGKIIHPFDSTDVPNVAKMTYNSPIPNVTGMEAIAEVISLKIIEHVQLKMELVAKPRLDNYGTEFDTMIQALDAFATAMNLVPVPINGTAIGTAMLAATTAMKVPQTARKTVLIPAETLDPTKVQFK